MGIFTKFFKKETSIFEGLIGNQINNIELKEYFANFAISRMKAGEDFDDLAYTSVDFGYLYAIENNWIEALYKVKTDKCVLYFGIRETKFMQLKMNEETFKAYTQFFNDNYK